MRVLKWLGLIILLASCSTPAPIAAPTLGSITTAPTLKSITATPVPTMIPPQPTIEPSKPIGFTPRFAPIASPRPTISPTPQAITITLFTIEPASIDPGDTITITWRTTGGQVSLFPINPFGQMSPPYQVDNNDSMVITTDLSQRNSIQFMLNVHDARLNKDIQAFASAAFRCPDVWFFHDGPASCPQSPAITGTAAIQHFEHGILIWLQPRNSITILYSDDQFSPKWDLRQDNYVDGQPESDPTLIPPKGKFQPIRGFGLVWRDEQATIGFRVRDRLGWAIDEEEPFQGALQCNSAIKYTTCYLKDDRGRTIELKPERSAWSYYPKPQ
jgi:hypothetical protein